MADVDGAVHAPAEHTADFHSHVHHVGAWNDFVMADVVAAEEQNPLAQNHQSDEMADATHVADVAGTVVVEEHTAQ